MFWFLNANTQLKLYSLSFKMFFTYFFTGKTEILHLLHEN
jgi:hypothetical protein